MLKHDLFTCRGTSQVANLLQLHIVTECSVYINQLMKTWLSRRLHEELGAS